MVSFLVPFECLKYDLSNVKYLKCIILSSFDLRNILPSNASLREQVAQVWACTRSSVNSVIRVGGSLCRAAHSWSADWLTWSTNDNVDVVCRNDSINIPWISCISNLPWVSAVPDISSITLLPWIAVIITHNVWVSWRWAVWVLMRIWRRSRVWVIHWSWWRSSIR